MMNETTTGSNKREPIVFDFDENEFDFKPITNGLGFHKGKKEEKKSIVTPKRNPNRAQGTLFSSTDSVVNDQMKNTELAAFYSEKTTISNEIQTLSKPTLKRAKNEKVLNNKNAPAFIQFSAFIIDLVLVVMATGVTTGLLVVISGLDYNLLVSALGEIEIAKFLISLFVIYYLSYFTIIDMAGSVGKSVMGIRLIQSEGKPLKVKNTFARAAFSLVGFIALGFPNIMDFQGKLSDTKLVLESAGSE